jgi:hypothetical protein
MNEDDAESYSNEIEQSESEQKEYPYGHTIPLPTEVPPTVGEEGEYEIDGVMYRTKTYTFGRERGGDCEWREGFVTIVSNGDYETKMNIRCNCRRFNCARNFTNQVALFKWTGEATVAAVIQCGRNDLGRADDTDIGPFKGNSTAIAGAFDEIYGATRYGSTCR